MSILETKCRIPFIPVISVWTSSDVVTCCWSSKHELLSPYNMKQITGLSILKPFSRRWENNCNNWNKPLCLPRNTSFFGSGFHCIDKRGRPAVITMPHKALETWTNELNGVSRDSGSSPIRQGNHHTLITASSFIVQIAETVFICSCTKVYG